MTLDGGAGAATIITGRVPNAWLEMQSLDEPAAAAGVFIKLLPADKRHRRTDLFVSREIAWHPDAAAASHSFRSANRCWANWASTSACSTASGSAGRSPLPNAKRFTKCSTLPDGSARIS